MKNCFMSGVCLDVVLGGLFFCFELVVCKVFGFG